MASRDLEARLAAANAAIVAEAQRSEEARIEATRFAEMQQEAARLVDENNSLKERSTRASQELLQKVGPSGLCLAVSD